MLNGAITGVLDWLGRAGRAWRYGLATAVWVVSGDVIALVIWQGRELHINVVRDHWVLWVVLGGGYLLWLAYQSGRAALSHDAGDTRVGPAGRWFWRGVLLNLSNPKSVLAWMAALSMGLDPNDSLGAVVLTTLVCIAVAFFNNLCYSLVFSLSGMMSVYRRTRRWIEQVA